MPTISLRLAVALALGAAVAGCALFRPAPTADERVRDVARRLAEAPSDSARRAVAVDLLAAAGLTPLAGEQFEYNPAAPVVAGFVPGRTPVERDTLVVVAADLSGPEAAVVVEAARALVETATRNEGPERSVLVALWAPGRTTEQGLADVLAFPLWPSAAVRAALVVGADAAPAGARGLAVQSARATPDGASAAALAARVRVLAARPVRPDTTGRDSVQAPLPRF